MDQLRSKLKLRKGFTLVEVLIVILIIALLMAFIIPQVLRGPAAARDATRIAHVGQIAVAIESYRSANRDYPPEGCVGPDTPAGDALIKGGFMTADKFPQDPDKNNNFSQCSDGQYFLNVASVNGVNEAAAVVFAKLETPGRATATSSDLIIGDLDQHVFGKVGEKEYYHQSSGQ